MLVISISIQRSAAFVASMAYPQSIRKYVYCVSWRRERDSQENMIEQKADTTKDAIEKKGRHNQRCDRTIDAIEQPVKKDRFRWCIDTIQFVLFYIFTF